jgi:ribosomal protein S27AE
MGAYRCPNCQATVSADSPDGLVCPRCGYGSTSPGMPAGTMGMAAPGMPGMPPGPVYQATQPLQTAGYMQGAGPMCPRCGSTYTQKGGIPTWAVLTAILGIFVVCLFSLLFLLVKDESTCYNCGMKWKAG